MFKDLELLKKRRNKTSIYTAIYENKKVIVKKGLREDIEFEESQKNHLIEEGYIVPKTLKILRDNSESSLVEEFIEEEMLIESILNNLSGVYINDDHLNSAILFFKKINYVKKCYDLKKDPFLDLCDSLNSEDMYIRSLVEKIFLKINYKKNLVLSHGDLTPFNISKTFKVIDFEDVSNYPMFFDMISFFYSYIWFPEQNLKIEGPYLLYRMSERQKTEVDSFLVEKIKRSGLDIELEPLEYIQYNILLRGVWHYLDCQEEAEFLDWRFNKIKEMALSVGLLSV